MSTHSEISKFISRFLTARPDFFGFWHSLDSVRARNVRGFWILDSAQISPPHGRNLFSFQSALRSPTLDEAWIQDSGFCRRIQTSRNLPRAANFFRNLLLTPRSFSKPLFEKLRCERARRISDPGMIRSSRLIQTCNARPSVVRILDSGFWILDCRALYICGAPKHATAPLHAIARSP